jgi:hypothetical protein
MRGPLVAFEELLPYIITLTAAAVAVLIILYSTRLRKHNKEPPEAVPSELEATERWRYRLQHSVTVEDAKEAREELRTLSLEREILSDAIRHLYEAHAEGKITEEERENLAKRYKSRMMKVKDAINESESVVALHELEAMQEDLIKLFDQRFDDLNTKIESLRTRIGLEARETIVPTPIPIAIPTQIEEEEEAEAPETEQVKRTKKKPPRRPPQKAGRTVAEERIERIKAEVEKVLDRLEQMEAET